MLFADASGLPALSQQGFDATAPSLPPVDSPASEPSRKPAVQVTLRLTLSMLSANVQSLQQSKHDGEGHPGRLQYIREQFKAHRFVVMALQEARTPQLCGTSDRVLRVSSGHRDGLYGNELWFALDQPYGYYGKKPLLFAKQHFVVLCAEPRLLIVRAQTEYLQALFVSAHAPHSGIERPEREAWWRHFTDCLSSFSSSGMDKLYVMIDANATSGRADHCSVGQYDAPPSSTTVHLREFLDAMDLGLPSTTSVHQGPHTTWTTPDGQHHSRIDYIAVPRSQMSDCDFSAVIDTLDLGNINSDHSAVGLQLNWQHSMSVRAPSSNCPRNYDRMAIANEELAEALRAYEVPPWHCDIEQHVQHYTKEMHSQLSRRCAQCKQGPKKSYITDAIWDLRTRKLACKKTLSLLRVKCSTNLLHACFCAWRDRRSAMWECSEQATYQATLWSCRLKVAVQLRSLALQLKQSLALSRAAFLRQQVGSLPHDFSAGQVLQIVKQVAGPTNPKRQMTTTFPAIRQEDGSLCTTAQMANDRWVQFFSTMEGGHTCTSREHRELWRQNLVKFTQTAFDIPLCQLPSLCDLERAFARVTKGKAIGMDGLPPELCKAHPAVLAKASYSQLLKLALHGHEAVEHKGGYLVQSWKGKGPRDQCSSYRSLLVSSHQGKALHRTLRQHHAGLYDEWLQAQQLGGRAHIPVGLGLHHVRSALRIDKGRGYSSGILFLDLKEAFYRVLRPLALQTTWTDDEIAAVAARLQLPTGALHDLHAHLRDPCAIEQARLPAYIQNYITAIHSGTWFHMKTQDEDEVVRTTIGSRPGDSYADVVFGFLWSRVLRSVETHLDDLGHLAHYECLDGLHLYDTECPSAPTRPFLGPNWMDDLAVCISAPTSDQLVSMLGTVAGTLLDSCQAHGMTPNLAPGKTELMVALRGKGSRKWRKHFFGPSTSKTLTALGEHTSWEIHVVGHYKHLGGIAHHRGDQAREAHARLAQAHQALSRHRRLLFHNTSLSFQKRRELFETLVLSAFTYGMESWHFDDRRSKEALHAGIIRLYRRFLGVPSDAELSDDQILARSALPSPTELLRRARLRYLRTLYRCGPAAEWGLLFRDQPWRDLIRDDLHWLWRQLYRSSSLQDPREHLPAWEYLLRYHGGYWKRLVNRGVRHAVLQRQSSTHVADFHARIFHRLCEAGTLATLAPTYVKPFVDQTYYGCLQCGVRCASRAGEGAHFFKVHQVINPVRFLFDSTQCPACLGEYHTVPKIQAHLRHSTACAELLQGDRLHCSPIPGIGSQSARTLQRAHDGLLPHLRAHGPLPRLVRRRARDVEHGDLIALLLDQVSRPQSLAELEQSCREAIVALPLSWTTFTSTLAYMREQYNQVMAEDTGFSVQDMVRMLLNLGDPSSWAFLRASSTLVDAIPDRKAHYELWCHRLAEHDQPWQSPTGGSGVPRPVGAERIILHAFSGRRRHGDYQWYLDHLAAGAPDGISVYVVSLDIVIDSRFGDLADPATRAFWLSHIRDGHVHGFLGGPPCCTFSKARAVSIASATGHRRGPRPVRSDEEPWGFGSLALRELLAVLEGNVLLSFCIEALFELVLLQRHGLLEHPAEPADSAAASIWKLPIMKLLLQFPNVQTIHLAQGLFGASSSKPTTFLVANCPSAMQILRKWQITTDNPRSATIGFDCSGQFRTAALKEYPPALCAALAHCTWDDITSHPVDASVQLPGEFAATCHKLTVTQFGEHIGLDHVQHRP